MYGLSDLVVLVKALVNMVIKGNESVGHGLCYLGGVEIATMTGILSCCSSKVS